MSVTCTKCKKSNLVKQTGSNNSWQHFCSRCNLYFTGINSSAHLPSCERDATVLEALADIAYIAGENRFYSGDSRQDVQTIIDIAFAFELKYAGTEWGEKLDYIETVTQFAYDELMKAKNL